jgi:prephenate dehydrogenase
MDVGLVGLGLIGGSVGLAMRAGGFEVAGFDPSETALQTAKDKGCIDARGSLEQICHRDLVFVSVPPLKASQVCKEVLSLKRTGTVVSDATSTKANLIASLPSDPMFVGGHPMAGAEFSGAEHARADLFKNATWIFTPSSFTSPAALEIVTEAVRNIGANPMVMEPDQHDAHVAVVSHLPHVFAGILVKLAAEFADINAGGGSWRDLTRVAGVDPDLWMQILTSNREEAAKMLSEAELQLGHLRKALIVEDRDAVQAFFEQAREAKGTLKK